MGRLGDVFTQGVGQLPGVNLLHGNGPLLGTGYALFRDEKHIPRLQQGRAVLLGHIADVVLVGDQVGGNGQAEVLHPVHLNDSLFALVGLQIRCHNHASLSLTPSPGAADGRPAGGNADGAPSARRWGRSCSPPGSHPPAPCPAGQSLPYSGPPPRCWRQ